MRLAGDDEGVARAAALLAAGELLAFATETVYGLGARADDDAAVAKIYAAKGRPAGHPLIVHVLGQEQALTFSDDFNPMAQALAQAFWPGPLTVIVRRRADVATAAAGHHPTVGLRAPAHPLARRLLHQAADLGVAGVAAPSANRFGRVSPTTAAHVEAEFGPELAVLDGGECEVGIESTIVDCSRAHPVLLRPGVLLRSQLEAALGQAVLDADAHAPKASGTLAAHYAPRAKVRLMPTAVLRQALGVLGPQQSSMGLAVYSRTVLDGVQGVPGVRHRAMAATAVAAAHELFAVLRELDDQGAQLIWIETPPAEPDWDGVRDRLQRAAAA